MTVSINGSTATATSPGYTTTGVGTEYWVATFNGDTNNAAVSSGTASETVNVDTITTSQAPAIAYVGESISDTATITGLVSPSSSDTVTFNLYNNSTASGTPLYTSSPVTVSISGSTATATSPGYTTTGVGTEYWVATFNGDTNNAAVSSGTAAETVNVDTITTSQTPAIAYVGESISDTATVTGLVSPGSGDTVTFNLYSSATTQNSSTLLHRRHRDHQRQRQHGHGDLEWLHPHRCGHGILGGHLQRRHQQRRRHQRRRGRDGQRQHHQHHCRVNSGPGQWDAAD